MIKVSTYLRQLKPEDTIEKGDVHSLNGITFNPIMNEDETVGQKVSEFSRKFYRPEGRYFVESTEE